MRGLTETTIALVLLGIAVVTLLAATVLSSGTCNPSSALLQPAGPLSTGIASVIAEPYQLNKTYFTNVTISILVIDTRLPSAFVTKVVIVNASKVKNLTYVPVKITYIADEYNNSETTEVVSSTDPEEVPIGIGYNLLTIKGFVVGNLSLSAHFTLILISFSNNETITVPALLNVTNASGT